MPHAGFVHLNVKSAYSLAEGAIHVKDLTKLCSEQNMPAMAITDTGNMFGSLEFSEVMAGSGIQPIIGCALSVRVDDGESGRLVLLVQNDTGYRNLLKLVSKSFLETEAGYDPHVSLADFAGHGEGLLCLTGGASGSLGRLLQHGQKDAGELLLDQLATIFPGRLYIELQRHNQSNENRIEPVLLDMAYARDIPIVATNEVYFATQDMHEAHDALICVAAGRAVAEEDRRKLTPEHYFKSAEEMKLLFADLPEAINNTLVIAQRCAYRVRTQAPILPNYTSDPADEPAEMRRMALEGLADRIEADVRQAGLSEAENEALAKPYYERLEYELKVIVDMGFPGYFLIVADFIQWAKRQGIPVGPGRGSGAGSVVAWALKITDLDPLRFGLLFERFLNPERISMPDFDIDFCQDKRDQVIHYVQEKYGYDQVAQIITFGKLQARAVLRDVGRVLQLPYGLIDRLSKMIPNNPANPTTLAEAVKFEPRLREAKQQEPGVDKLLDIALRLEGLYRHASTHAAGVVIGDRPLDQLVPLYRDPRSDMPVTQFNMKWVEPAGLVKFDFLGLKTLTVLNRAVDFLKQRQIDVDIDHLPLDDVKTYEMISRGDTVGIFQLESSGMRDMLRKMRPDAFEDIIAIVALYRPGPMDNIPRFINVKHGVEKPDYLHPMLEEVLKETYGVIVYQEQVMQIPQILAGYSLGDADLLRRAMGKKIQSEMDAQRAVFMAGAEKNNVDREQASYIFDLVNKFAGYGFNKSHAAAYALVAYQTGYLKSNYPVEFMAASMCLDLGNTDKLNVFRQELQRMEIELLPPNINASDVEFAVEEITGEEKGIRYALAAVKNVGREAMRAIVEERQANGAFADIWDFARRVDPRQLNKRQVENLARAGAFDGLAGNRAQIVEAAELIMRYALATTEEKESNQKSLFGDVGGEPEPTPPLPIRDDWAVTERLANEFDAIGFYLSAHPLDAYVNACERQKVKSFAQVLDALSQGGSSFRMAGTILNKKERKSQRGKAFAFVQLSDQTGMFEVTCFEETLNASRQLLEPGRSVIMTIGAELRDDQPRLTVNSIEDIEANSLRAAGGIRVFLRDEKALPSIQARFSEIPKGRAKVLLMLNLPEQNREVEVTLKDNYAISPATRGAIKAVAGVVDVHDL
jgi:DNA polymerase-3 subunit alpha